MIGCRIISFQKEFCLMESVIERCCLHTALNVRMISDVEGATE